MRLPTIALLPLVLLVLLSLVSPALGAFGSSSKSGMSFCKCLCFNNATILPLYLPKDPLYPCLSCTRQFCLDQKLAACIGATTGDEDLDTGTGEEGDVEARCFQRDSPKAHVLVVLFIIVTVGLLATAGLKHTGIELNAATIPELVQIIRARAGIRRRPVYASMGG